MKFSLNDYVYITVSEIRYVGIVSEVRLTASGNYYGVTFAYGVIPKLLEEAQLGAATVTFEQVSS